MSRDWLDSVKHKSPNRAEDRIKTEQSTGLCGANVSKTNKSRPNNATDRQGISNISHNQ